jgi:formate dehydrogenase maturation protein FdhE
MSNNDEIIDEAEHKADQMREVCETNEDKEDAACVNDEGLFCSEHWTEFLNYLIDEGRQDERAECVAELEKLRSKTHQDEELIGIDQAIAALKHEAKTKEVE